MCANATVYINKPENFKPKVEVVGCFLECQSQILLLHRQHGKDQGNLWGIPGGKLESQETALSAAIRETFEETRFDISKEKIDYLGCIYIKYPKSDFIYHMIKCRPLENRASVKIKFDEHKGFTWVTPQEALQMPLMLDEDTCIKLIYGL